MYDFSNLSRAVTYWLNYKKLTGLEDLFSEASLVVPIAEFLKTKNVPKLRAEVNHPIFKSRRGRPRQVDFVGYSRKGRWTFVIEAKYLPSTMQAMVNDLGRLLFLDKDNCERFMVIGLPREEGKGIDEAFRIGAEVAGRRVNALERIFCRKKDKERIVNIRNEPTEISNLFKNFMDDYSVEEMPNAFQTKCLNFTTTKFFAAGMWRISARRGTGTISVSDI